MLVPCMIIRMPPLQEPFANKISYGVLYNWVAAKKVVPDGWKLPTESDIVSILRAFLGTNAGTLLKEAGTEHWNVAGGTDLTGFGGFGGDIGLLTVFRLTIFSKPVSGGVAPAWRVSVLYSGCLQLLPSLGLIVEIIIRWVIAYGF